MNDNWPFSIVQFAGLNDDLDIGPTGGVIDIRLYPEVVTIKDKKNKNINLKIFIS